MGGALEFMRVVCVVVLHLNQAEHQYYDSRQALTDPSLQEETVGLLGEDAMRGTGGSQLRLG